eukprot:m.494736 g.494736  ORF g.494736 m.494736 type:complete len:687 (+) comp41647_c0_seq1:253-2313(+)
MVRIGVEDVGRGRGDDGHSGGGTLLGMPSPSAERPETPDPRHWGFDWRHALPTRDTIQRHIPALSWLPSYRFRRDALGDLMAGLIVGVFQVTEGLAYALLANVPPVYGLYVPLMTAVVYFFLGSSRHLSVGTESLIALMIGTVVSRHVDLASEGHEAEAVRIATVLALMVGCTMVLMGLLRWGFVTLFMSPALISGFTTGAAFHIVMSQLWHLVGRKSPSYPPSFGFVRELARILGDVPHYNAAAFVCGVSSLVLLAIVRFFNKGGRITSHGIRWPWSPDAVASTIPFPGELLVVAVSTVVSFTTHLPEKYDLDILGPISQQLPSPGMSAISVHQFTDIIGEAVLIAVVGLILSYSFARSVVPKEECHIDGNQEFLALGMCHIVGAFFGSFMCVGSVSRTAVAYSAGAHSQVFSLVAALVCLLVILVLAPALTYLPKAALAAIVIAAVARLFLQFKDAVRLWKIKKTDFAVWVGTFTGVLLLGVVAGLAIGAAVTVIALLWATVRPPVLSLGRIKRTSSYAPLRTESGSPAEDVEEVPGVKIIRFTGNLYFANTEYFLSATLRAVGLASDKEGLMRIDPRKSVWTFELPVGNKPTNVIVLDCSSFTDIDSAAADALCEFGTIIRENGVKLLLAGVPVGVHKVLNRSRLGEIIGRDAFLPGVHEAVLHATFNIAGGDAAVGGEQTSL